MAILAPIAAMLDPDGDLALRGSTRPTPAAPAWPAAPWGLAKALEKLEMASQAWLRCTRRRPPRTCSSSTRCAAAGSRRLFSTHPSDRRSGSRVCAPCRSRVARLDARRLQDRRPAPTAAGSAMIAAGRLRKILRADARPRRTSPSSSARASAWPCSGRTAPARPRCSASWPPCCGPRRARSRIAGARRGQASPRRPAALIGMVAHGSYVYEDLTALENLRFWTVMCGRGRLARRGSAQPSRQVELDGVAGGARAHLLGGHEAAPRPRPRRCWRARGSSCSTSPSPDSTSAGRKWLNEFLLAFKARGGAVVIATHSFATRARRRRPCGHPRRRAGSSLDRPAAPICRGRRSRVGLYDEPCAEGARRAPVSDR